MGYVILGVIVLLVFVLVLMYNSLISLRNRVKEAFSDIGVQQKRRYNLIPNLIETVKGYAKHEKETLEDVVKARTNAMNANEAGDIEKMQETENMLSSTLKSIFALSESYPDLKANENFMNLQNELTDTEDKIMSSRRFYNNNVQLFNTKIEQVPTNIIAKIFGFAQEKFFQIKEEEKENIKVSF